MVSVWLVTECLDEGLALLSVRLGMECRDWSWDW